MEIFSFTFIVIFSIFFSIVFTKLFDLLDKNIHLFNKIKKRTNKLKRKNLCRALATGIMCAVATEFKNHYTLSNTNWALLFGLFFALIEVSFDKQEMF